MTVCRYEAGTRCSFLPYLVLARIVNSVGFVKINEGLCSGSTQWLGQRSIKTFPKSVLTLSRPRLCVCDWEVRDICLEISSAVHYVKLFSAGNLRNMLSYIL